MRALPRLVVPVAVLVVLGGLLAACGGDDEPARADATPTPTATPTSTPVETVTPSPSPTPTPTASSSAVPLKARFLTAAEVPGLNASWEWSRGKDSTGGTKPFGACANVDVAGIGAVRVLQRSYFPPVDTDDSAAEQLAEYPDAKTASTASAVLRSWRTQCAAKIKSTGAGNVVVGPLIPVTTTVGKGYWYLARWVPEGSEEGRFHAFGLVVTDTTIASLVIENGGQDYNYPVGKEPMVVMVKAAAGKLA